MGSTLKKNIKRTLKDARFKKKYGRYTNITGMISTGISIVITLEAKKSLMQYTNKDEFYFEFINRSKIFLLDL